jgi:hypothetical protein
LLRFRLPGTPGDFTVAGPERPAAFDPYVFEGFSVKVFDPDGSDAMRRFLMASPILGGGNLIVTEQGIRDGVRRRRSWKPRTASASCRSCANRPGWTFTELFPG